MVLIFFIKKQISLLLHHFGFVNSCHFLIVKVQPSIALIVSSIRGVMSRAQTATVVHNNAAQVVRGIANTKILQRKNLNVWNEDVKQQIR